jgi:hypothetical protein
MQGLMSSSVDASFALDFIAAVRKFIILVMNNRLGIRRVSRHGRVRHLDGTHTAHSHAPFPEGGIAVPRPVSGCSWSCGRSSLMILKKVKKTPTLAVCSKCQRNFFTPISFYKNRIGAEQYLQAKFDLHLCEKEANDQLGAALVGAITRA